MWDSILLLLVFVVVLFVLYARNQHCTYPPGPTILHILATALYFKGAPQEFFSQIARKYGSVFRLKVGLMDIVVLNDWKVIKEALVEKDKDLNARPANMVWKYPLNNKGIGVNSEENWQEEKQFTMKYLKTNMKTFEEFTLAEAEKLLEVLADSAGCKICITDLFFEPCFNIFINFLMGKTELSEIGKRQLKHGMEGAVCNGGANAIVNYIPFLRFVPKCTSYAAFVESFRKIENVMTPVIDEHFATFKENEPPRDYLDLYIGKIRDTKHGVGRFDLQNLISTTATLSTAGVETIESTLQFAFLYVTLWPEIQQKVQQELDEVVGRSRLPEYKDHTMLPYTQATILEIYRFSNIVPLFAPHSPIRPVTISGYDIPPNCFVTLNMWAVHCDKDLWGDPEVFRPERFLDPNGKVTKPEYLKPFSTGSRVCPGKSLANLETFLFFTLLLQRFSFHSVTGEQPLTFDTLTGLTIRPKPFRLIVKARY